MKKIQFLLVLMALSCESKSEIGSGSYIEAIYPNPATTTDTITVRVQHVERTVEINQLTDIRITIDGVIEMDVTGFFGNFSKQDSSDIRGTLGRISKSMKLDSVMQIDHIRQYFQFVNTPNASSGRVFLYVNNKEIVKSDEILEFN